MKTLHKTIICLAALMLLAMSAHADIKDEPGYLDLSFITIPDHADEVQDIDLTTILVDIAEDAREEGEAELAEVLSMVRSVRVKSFIVDRDDGSMKRDVERVLRQLDDDDWTRIIYIKDGDETVSVSTMNDDGDIVGLTVVVYEPDESAVFVNVVGEIDLGKLMTIAHNIDFDDMDEYLDQYDTDAQ